MENMQMENFSPDNLIEKQNEEAEVSEKEISLEIALFQKLEEETREDKNLARLFQEVKQSVTNYAERILIAEHIAMRAQTGYYGEDTIDRISQSDNRRRFAHEVLIDSLNALARLYQKHDLDNEWRRSIGLERTEIGEWGLRVARFMKNEELRKSEKKGDHQ